LLKHDEVPEGWSQDAADFANALIQRKPGNRLGLNGPSEVKSHPWLAGIDWKVLACKTLPSPFKPPS
jgi:hypothetical protein